MKVRNKFDFEITDNKIQSVFVFPPTTITNVEKFDFFQKKYNSVLIGVLYFPVENATLTNKQKLASQKNWNCEEHPRNNLGQNTKVTGSHEDIITQVSEEIEGRVTEKLSKEFSKMESRTLGALSQLDGFLLNSLVQGHSGSASETSRNALRTN